MIKYVGFIKEYNDIEEAICLSNIKGTKALVDNELIHKVMDYLNHGEFIFGWMNYIIDVETTQPLVPDCYYSDGSWIWPEYFKYYLTKYPNYPLDEKFIEYIKDNNFKVKGKINIVEIEKIFMKKLSIG